MVIGNGMLAKAFKQYENDNEIIIFASGVSNSKENNPEAFKREVELLNALDKNSLLVYFSTCSIYDSESCNSEYVKHKHYMENLISNSFKKKIIFRLPIVVGKTDNQHTLFNFFKNKIQSELELRISPETTRFLIDIDDLIEILPPIIEEYKKNDVVDVKLNIAFDNRIEVLHLATMMMQILKKNSPIVFEGITSKYEVDNCEFKKILDKRNYQLKKNYTYNLLKKYLL